jgi:hypothetical protein
VTDAGDGVFAVRGRARGCLSHHGGSERDRVQALWMMGCVSERGSVRSACVFGSLLLVLVDVAAVESLSSSAGERTPVQRFAGVG